MLQRIKGKLETTYYDRPPAFKDESGELRYFKEGDYIVVINLYPEIDNSYSIVDPILVWEGFINNIDGGWLDWRERMGKEWTEMFYMGYDVIVVRKAISIEKLLEWENE